MITVSGVCSGIGGFDLAFERSGAKILWSCEVDRACRNVLAHRFPGVPCYADMLSDEIMAAPTPDVLVGGTPCQGFSVAGLRKGLNDDRSNLALRFCQLANRFDPSIILWENVPGVLSMPDNAFGCFLGGLVGADAALVCPASAGWRWTNAGLVTGPRRTAAWRVLDSQYFGVAQRRKRVFVVASPRAELPFKILFEPEVLRRHFAPSREKGQGTAPTLAARTRGGGGLGTDAECDGALIACSEVSGTLRNGGSQDGASHGKVNGSDRGELIAFGGNNTSGPVDVATACNAHGGTGRSDFESETFVATAPPIISNPYGDHANGFGHVSVAFQPRYFNDRKHPAGKPDDIIPPLTANAKSGEAHPCVAFKPGQGGKSRSLSCSEDLSPTLESAEAGNNKPAICQGYAVRRLTPRECEILQGFPIDWTYVETAKGKHQADGPRYKQLGNAVTVNVVKWLARRIIQALESDAHQRNAYTP